MTEATDGAVTSLSETVSGTLQHAILSCFLYKEQFAPVLNVAYLCSKEFRTKMLAN